MELHTWIAFLIAASLIAVSPGSGAVLSMGHGLSYGVRQTGATIVGLELGLLLILLVAGAGVGSLLVASEVAFSAVKVLGAGYLVYLGFTQWRAPVVVPGAAETGGHGGASAPPLSWQRRCATGFFTNATNPKGIVFMVAVLPQFIADSRPLWLQLAVMALTMAVVDTLVMHGYAMGASALRGLLRSPRAVRTQNRVFGGLLMAVGTSLFFVKRTQQHG